MESGHIVCIHMLCVSICCVYPHAFIQSGRYPKTGRYINAVSWRLFLSREDRMLGYCIVLHVVLVYSTCQKNKFSHKDLIRKPKQQMELPKTENQ